MNTFPELCRASGAAAQLENLLAVTQAVGQYRLVLKKGEQFKPVMLRTHPDPIGLIQKILEQNERSM